MLLPASARIGQLHVERRYLPSADGPGGDIHDVVTTRFGVRLLVGDVMGTGEEANRVGASVLSAWRELARSEASLAGVAVRLHALITRSEHPERFVTAILMNFPDSVGGLAEMVCCGHPPPLLVHDGVATFIGALPFPPLGLLDLAEGWCAANTIRFGDGEQLLLYTDGASEARDVRDRFFPLSEHAALTMRGQHPLDVLMASLLGHIGDRMASADDILLVLVRRG
jgi:serine phosphatase RsbU (regulator of sigma subunit)